MSTHPDPAVDAYFAGLDHQLADVAAGMRAVLLASHPAVVESIKWKAPNYAAADDFATLSLRRANAAQLVLHTGAKAKPEHPQITVDDALGLLRWADANRAVVTFTSAASFEDARASLAVIVRDWAAQVRADV